MPRALYIYNNTRPEVCPAFHNLSRQELDTIYNALSKAKELRSGQYGVGIFEHSRVHTKDAASLCSDCATTLSTMHQQCPVNRDMCEWVYRLVRMGEQEKVTHLHDWKPVKDEEGSFTCVCGGTKDVEGDDSWITTILREPKPTRIIYSDSLSGGTSSHMVWYEAPVGIHP